MYGSTNKNSLPGEELMPSTNPDAAVIPSTDLEHGEGRKHTNNVNTTDLEGPTEKRISFSEMGIPKSNQPDKGLSGMVRRFSDIPILEKIYALAMIGAILTLMVFTIYRLTQVDEHNSDFIFGLVLLVNSVFCLIYIFDAVKREKPSELFILSLATTLMVIYLIVNYSFGKRNDVKLARMIIATGLAIPLVIFGLKTAYEYYISRNLIFRTVGANSQLQDLLQRLHFFQDFLKFDLELGISMVILILTSRLSVATKDIVILSVGSVMTFGWFLFGYLGFKNEVKFAVIFFPLGLPEIGYIIYKMYDVSSYIDSHSGLAGATIACACAALVVRIIVLIMGYFVYRGFGNGLKEKL